MSGVGQSDTPTLSRPTLPHDLRCGMIPAAAWHDVLHAAPAHPAARDLPEALPLPVDVGARDVPAARRRRGDRVHAPLHGVRVGLGRFRSIRSPPVHVAPFLYPPDTHFRPPSGPRRPTAHDSSMLLHSLRCTRVRLLFTSSLAAVAGDSALAASMLPEGAPRWISSADHMRISSDVSK